MLNRLARSFAPALVLAMLPVASFAGIAVGVSINIAPPLLPVYVQPAPPAADYIWTPGYWAYGDDGYYWVPGTWVLAPEPGLLWTPGYWGWEGGGYLWHGGYWGPHVGFYGGVNYGFGYGGVGFQGGYWRGGHVVYNRSVTNVTNINVTNVYNKTVVVHNVNHVSFNGGNGGISMRPSAGQLAAEHDHHFDPTPMQRQHIDMAAKDRDLRASVNNGRPHIAATARPAASAARTQGVRAAAVQAALTRSARVPTVRPRLSMTRCIMRSQRAPARYGRIVLRWSTTPRPVLTPTAAASLTARRTRTADPILKALPTRTVVLILKALPTRTAASSPRAATPRAGVLKGAARSIPTIRTAEAF